MKAFASWLLSKAAVLIFAVMIFSAFFYFFIMQQGFLGIDKEVRKTENLARLIESVCSSPYHLEYITNFSFDRIETFTNDSGSYLKTTNNGRVVVEEVNCMLEDSVLENVTAVKIINNGNVSVVKWI